MAEAAVDATRTARSILLLRETHRDLLVARLGARAGKGLAILEDLYRSPYIDVAAAVDKLSVSFANANTIIGEMEKLGILEEVTGNRRNRVFIYESYLALFRDL